MTAEIGLLNKSAVALAADSAVTIRTSNGQKIYNTVNKLFCLNKHHPVGIMVYGNANLNSVPWESLIKLYRTALGTKCFGTIEEYAKDFFRFLEKDAAKILAAGEEDYFFQISHSYLSRLRTSFRNKVEDEFEQVNQVKKSRSSRILSDLLRAEKMRWRRAPVLKIFAKTSALKVINPYRGSLNRAINSAFEKYPVNNSQRRQIYEIIGSLFIRKLYSDGARSGVVIAGFGSKQHYPQLVSYHVEGYISKRLKYSAEHTCTITNNHSAAIYPFAQSEMVVTFMEGIDPNLKGRIDKYLDEILTELPAALLTRIKAEGGNVPKKVSAILSKTTRDVRGEIAKELADYMQQNHSQPVMDITDILPKDELAATAESLVNLTSFRRRVTLDAETVGGPIDVAVISKGDGFIWIKRKHYFKAELNPAFFAKQAGNK